MIRTWEALGTYVELDTSAAHIYDAAQLAGQLLAYVDATCSRFRSDSDLRAVNAGAGSWVAADPMLVAAVRVAIAAAQATDGLVHPLLGRSLVALGYDQDLPGWGVDTSSTAPVPADPDSWRRIDLDEGHIRIPAGTALDLGATGKAFAADLIAERLFERHPIPVMVNLGGDLRFINPDKSPVEVAVAEHPDGSGASQDVQLDGGGMATSSVTVRRWTSAGAQMHHLLDPSTGLPCEVVWRTVTATGPTAVAANTASTAAVLMGEGAEAWLNRHRVDARLVHVDGTVSTTGEWPVEEQAA